MAGSDGDAVVGRVDDLVVERFDERRILRRSRADAVTEQNPAAGKTPVVLVGAVGRIGLPRFDDAPSM